MDHHISNYSGNVRQQLHKMFNSNEHGGLPVHIWEGFSSHYSQLRSSAKFCLAPYGYGWGSRLAHMVLAGCVPVIIQASSAAWPPGSLAVLLGVCRPADRQHRLPAARSSSCSPATPPPPAFAGPRVPAL
jgi:hypothetical protein